MEMIKTIAMRKSTRSYKTQQISDEDLAVILNAGCAAPVGMGAYDSVNITVIQKPELLEEITKVTANVFANPKMKPFYGAPTLIVISGKPNEKAPSIEVANAACIIENMTLAATDMGLGSVYLWAFLSSFSADKKLLKQLNLPEGFVPVSGIVFGYPIEALTKEKELKQTIKINTIK